MPRKWRLNLCKHAKALGLVRLFKAAIIKYVTWPMMSYFLEYLQNLLETLNLISVLKAINFKNTSTGVIYMKGLLGFLTEH